jgi:type IX secretion system PorP/SprF family membrane protein
MGQEAHFSQFYANSLYLNPAYAGTDNCPRISINFRDQWPTIPGNFITFSGSYDQHINIMQGGIGVLVSGDIGGGGILQTYNAGVIYNYRFNATRQLQMQLALQAGYMTTSLLLDRLKFASEMIHSNAPDVLPIESQQSRISQFDASFGMLGYTSYLHFGLAVHHLLPMKKNFFSVTNNKWVPKWTAHIGGKIKITERMRHEANFGDISLHPNLIFISQGNFHYLHEGFYFKFYPFTIGTWLRHSFKNLDAFIVTCGIEYKNFRVGYAYDFNLTKLERTGGSHEVSLQFIFPCNTKTKYKKSARKYPSVECPKF